MTKESELAKRIVDKMYDSDLFSQWLGIERLVTEQGYCVLRMTVRKEMLNGFGIVHGGIAFSLADSALAFASNAYGRLSVALECSISYPVAVHAGEVLTCEAKELSITKKTASYFIEIKNQKDVKVAFFRGTVYRTNKEWFSNNENLQL
jgi:acyl-CoA thioesterase